jgi:hypothetical protein
MDQTEHASEDSNCVDLQQHVRKDKRLDEGQGKEAIKKHKKAIPTIPINNSVTAKARNRQAKNIISQVNVNRRKSVHKRFHQLPTYVDKRLSQNNELEELG